MKRGWLQFFFIAMLICTGANIMIVAASPSFGTILGLIGSGLLALGFGLQLKYGCCLGKKAESPK